MFFLHIIPFPYSITSFPVFFSVLPFWGDGEGFYRPHKHRFAVFACESPSGRDNENAAARFMLIEMLA